MGRAARQLGVGAAIGLTLLHAVLFYLSFHPATLWPLAFICAVPLARVVRDARRSVAVGLGFAGFVLHGGLAVEWLRLLELPPWLGTAFGFGLYGLAFIPLARSAAGLGLPATLWLPVAWCAVEHLRGTLFFFAFPWVYLGHAVFPLPLIQSADLGGQNLVSFVVALVNGLALDLWDARAGRLGALGRAGWRALWRRRAAPVAAVFVALNVYGLVRPHTIDLEEGPVVLAVQSNLPQRLKNETSMSARQRFDHLTALTMEGARGRKVDVIAWPETMLPLFTPSDPRLPYEAIDTAPSFQRMLAVEVGLPVGAPILAGSAHAEMRDGEAVAHNSIFHIAPDGDVLSRYDKVFLAPMSEYAPLQTLWPSAHAWLRANFIPEGFTQFERGRSTRLFDVGGFAVGGSVCFDITFARASRDAVRAGARGIVNVSNYAWFQDSAELDLARVHTRLRAIETRRGIASVCNAGITHFVDARGHVTDFVAPDGRTKEVPGSLALPLSTSSSQTLFLVTGELFAWALVALAVAFALAFLVRRRAPRGGPARSVAPGRATAEEGAPRT